MAKTRVTPAGANGKSDGAIPDHDAWAYTPEHREAVRRALEDSAAGRVYRLSEEDLVQLMDEAEQARREGRAYRLPREWLKARDAVGADAELRDACLLGRIP